MSDLVTFGVQYSRDHSIGIPEIISLLAVFFLSVREVKKSSDWSFSPSCCECSVKAFMLSHF